MGATLKRLGYMVTVVTDPAEAWSMFREDPARFDLVIADQSMPGMTGLRNVPIPGDLLPFCLSPFPFPCSRTIPYRPSPILHHPLSAPARVSRITQRWPII